MGLKHAPATWNKKFTVLTKQIGLGQCMFKNNTGLPIMAIYVGDGIIIGGNKEETKRVIKKLEEERK